MPRKLMKVVQVYTTPDIACMDVKHLSTFVKTKVHLSLAVPLRKTFLLQSRSTLKLDVISIHLIAIVQQGMNRDKPYFSNISGACKCYNLWPIIPFCKQDISGYKTVWYLF